MEEKWVRIYIGLIDVMCYLNLQHKRKPLGNNLNEFNESLIMQKRSYILEAINAKLLVLKGESEALLPQLYFSSVQLNCMHLSVEINEMPIKYDCSMTLLTFSEKKRFFCFR